MTIQAYKTNQTNAMKITDFTALLLKKAADHMKSSLVAMEQKDCEKQFYFSTIACDILQGLLNYVVDVNPEQARVAQTLRNYYSDMIILITRMNIKLDLKTGEAIVASLESMSRTWYEIGQAANAIEPQPYMKYQSDQQTHVIYSA